MDKEIPLTAADSALDKGSNRKPSLWFGDSKVVPQERVGTVLNPDPLRGLCTLKLAQ